MPVHNVESTWSGGNLYFFEKAVGRSVTGDVLSIRTGSVIIGGTSQDVDFGWYATGSKSFVLDAGAGTLTIAGVDVSLTGDLTIDTEDINLGDGDDLEFGDSQDVCMRFSTADDSNHAFVLALDNTSQQMHVTDKGAIATDWNRSAGTHPEVAIHSNTTPATDYLAIGNHDGTTAHVNVVGGTTLSLDIAGTAEVLVTASATTPATSDSNALGTTSLMWSDLFLASGAVINFNNGNATITHSAGLLTLGSAGLSVGASGAGFDVIFYGDTANCDFLWDQNLDTNGGLQLGADTKATYFYAYGATTGNYLKWDAANDDLLLVGTGTQLGIAGTTDASSTSTGSIHTAGGIGAAGKLYVGGDVNLGTNAIDILVKANTATALEFYDSTTKFIAVDTRNTVTGVSNLTFTAMPSTITAASGVTKNLLTLAPGTTTLTGSTGVTAMNGLGLSVSQPTITDEDAVTVTTASTVYIANAPTGAGSGPATLSNAYALYVAAGESLFAGAVTINEAGADVNFRVESDNMAYALYLDGGKDSVVIGSNTDTSSADQLINITRAARTATAATNYYDLAITPAGAVTVPSGTTALVSTVRIDEPNITATGTVTAASSLYIAGAPSEGTNNYALFVDGGNARFDGNLITASNVGAANTGVTAAEYGDGYTHTTVLTVSQVDALTTGDNGNLCCGYLVYTLPAGAIVVERAYMSMAITHGDVAAQSDTPDVGIGTTLGSAVQATLDADNAACENIITGQAANDCNGTAEVKTIANQELVIESGNDHTVYFNAGAAWSDVTDTSADIAGTIVLVWRFIA